MSWTVDASGTQTATVGTEHTLATPTANGTYFFNADVSNLVAGETVEFRVYAKVLSGGSLKQVWKGTFDYAEAQINPVAAMPPIAAPYGAKFTLKQLTGTGRNFDWAEGYV